MHSKFKNIFFTYSIEPCSSAIQFTVANIVVNPHAHLAYLEFRFAAAAWHHNKASYYISLAGEGEGPSSKSTVQCLLNSYHFHTTVALKHWK